MGGGVGEEGREQWPEGQLHWQVGPPLPLICDALDYVGWEALRAGTTTCSV